MSGDVVERFSFQNCLHGSSADDRFEAQYIPEPMSGCWLWLGATKGNKLQYGRLQVAGKTIAAHRYSYEMHKGPIEAGKMVLHRCDVPTCVNPAHLFLGTAADNSRDRDTKLRHAHGRRHGSSKLDDETVRFIRETHLDAKAVSKRLGVDRSLIYQVRRRVAWRHVS